MVSGFSADTINGCTPVSDSIAYNLGGWGYMPTQNPQPWSAGFEVLWYLDTDCLHFAGTAQVGEPVTEYVFFTINNPRDTWQYLHQESLVPPPGTHAMRLDVVVTRPDTGAGLPMKVYVDSLYVTPAPGRF
jgi:hypothetical protein